MNHKKRNTALIDKWSLVHVVTGVALGGFLNPWLAILLMSAWEPLEIFVISPLLDKRGVTFGYESWRNSLSDILFNCIGVGIGYLMFGLN